MAGSKSKIRIEQSILQPCFALEIEISIYVCEFLCQCFCWCQRFARRDYDQSARYFWAGLPNKFSKQSSYVWYKSQIRWRRSWDVLIMLSVVMVMMITMIIIYHSGDGSQLCGAVVFIEQFTQGRTHTHTHNNRK